MISVAIVGASGLVGQEIINILYEEGLIDKIKLTLYVSKKSAGKRLFLNGKEWLLEELSASALNKKHDFVFFSAGDNVSFKWAKKFACSGSVVIDNSNAFRREKNIPLVVPEINKFEIKKSKLVANPNCSTIQMVVVLNRLIQLSKILKVVVSTYQSVSGAGKKALLDLENQTNNQIVEGITNNVIAKIGTINESGFSSEEDKIMFETNKILNQKIDVVATAVRVPVPYCHAESVYVEFENEINFNEITSVLDCEEIVFDSEQIFLPTNCVKSNKTFVCRMRKINSKAISFFVVADNLRRGAAFNAVEIFKCILNQKQTK